MFWGFCLFFSGKQKSACVLLCFIAGLGGLVDELLVIWDVMKVHTLSSWVTKLESEPPALGWDVWGAWDAHSSGLEEEEMSSALMQRGTRGPSTLAPAKVFGWETTCLEAGTVGLGLAEFLF